MIFNNYAIEAGPFNSSHSLSPTAAGTHTNYNIMSEQSAAEYFLFSLYIFRFSLNFTFYIPYPGSTAHSTGRLLFLYNGRWMFADFASDVDVDFHARVHKAILAKMFFNCT